MKSLNRFLPVCLIAAIVSLAPSVTYAGPNEDYDRAAVEFRQQMAAKDYPAAREAADRMRQLAKGPLRSSGGKLALAVRYQGRVLEAQGKHEDALELYEWVLTSHQKRDGPLAKSVAVSLIDLGDVTRALSRYDESEQHYRAALEVYEKSSGPESRNVGFSLWKLGLLFREMKRYESAAEMLEKSLEIDIKVHGAEHADVAITAYRLGSVYRKLRRFDDAVAAYQQTLAIEEKLHGRDHTEVAGTLNSLANVYDDQARYAEAEPLYLRALAIREQKLGSEHPDTATSLNNLALLYDDQGRYADAEPLCRRALAIREKVLGNEHPSTSTSLNNLASLYDSQGRYAEAEPLYLRALAIKEQVLGSEHPDTALGLNNLAYLYNSLGRYEKAEPLYLRALAIREQVLGAEHPDTASSLNNLAMLYKAQGRYAEVEPLYLRALAIDEKVLGSQHPGTAIDYNNLAMFYKSQGRYAEAEPLYLRALAIDEKVLGPEHPSTAIDLNNLALLYDDQERFDEAEPLFLRALAIREKVLGNKHPSTASSLNNLASLYDSQGRYAEAEPLYVRALAIKEQVLGGEHPDTANGLNNLAYFYNGRGRYTEAEPLYLRALAIREQVLGSEHPDTANSLNNVAWFYLERERGSEAEAMADRAIRILERTRVEPDLLVWSYKLRAKLGWRAGRRREAVADLGRALDLAEQLRGQVSGSARERAQFFGQFADEFEMMVQWQIELDNVGEVLIAIEQGRARSLLDDMNLEGADLQLGRPALEREQLRRRDQELKTRIASLQHQLDQLGPPNGESADAAKQRTQLQQSLAQVRGELYQHHRDTLSSNPIYRNLLSVGAGPPRLSQLQREVAGTDGLLLVYLLGEEGGYVVAVGSDAATATKLEIDPAAAAALGIEAGPLTAQRLQAALVDEQGSGAVQLLSQPKFEPQAAEKLHALYQVLLPESVRTRLTGGQVAQLLVVPSGPLALLPLETLVVEPGPQPKFLLDVGPPILYGPSATILYNLLVRGERRAPSADEPVLSVGNPSYDGQLVATDEGALEQLSARSRYSSVGGQLRALPYTELECEWVADAFQQANTPSRRLNAGTATEANVRAEVAGRRLVHLACHGLVDQAYGNFFGALALTPGAAEDNSANDGFLTLPEIYQLNLTGCELAILSACETNYGPQQKGEGVWALSRGFLVAGSRRVVASNWLVDDEAAANLISVFCGGVAQAEQQGDALDYAKELHTAKLLVRKQEKWSSPYYWGTFVLVGPN